MYLANHVFAFRVVSFFTVHKEIKVTETILKEKGKLAKREVAKCCPWMFSWAQSLCTPIPLADDLQPFSACHFLFVETKIDS